ncbi:MAG: amidohydrolase family protein [Bryobacteraceae bacterium]|nr:amidohydrolase family protein [Bryobacteraceae bacterium]
MSTNGNLHASRLRASLSHPIIDADGHWLEYGPVVRDQLKRIGGDKAVEGFSLFGSQVMKTLSMSVAERRDRRIAQEAWWALPTKNTRDRATAMMPRLLYERMEELGLDFAVLYPTAGLGLPRIADAEIRRVTCRAFNVFSADYFRAFSDRMTPAAVIPMHTPEEAVAELEFVTQQLGLKVVMLWSMIRRPIPAYAGKHPDLDQVAVWFDPLGLDSEYDYDPVWAKCAELGVSPTFHTGSRGYGLRVSPTNFTYNHIGHFAVAHEAVCKALFLGGVTRRFPHLKFGFLEGGVGWACQLYADLIGHWEKRNLEALEEVNPQNLDRALLVRLAETYGDPAMVSALRQRNAQLDPATFPQGSGAVGGIENLDDYAACRITRKEELRDLFVGHFYFGCEADDPMNAWAFHRRSNPFGARLNALFGSDIGHFDVPDMAHVVPEAYELVEDGLISEEDFRDFVFTNPMRFWGEANPRFFEGTAVEAAAAAVLAKGHKEGDRGLRPGA